MREGEAESMENKRVEQLFDFISKSVSSFHTVANIKEEMKAGGFTELDEKEEWKLEAGGKYVVSRNGSSVLAFTLPKEDIKGFRIVAAHSDSPTFKIKETPEMAVEEQYLKLNCETYGGMILSTWLDRPLSVAGRVVIKEKDTFISKLVNVDRDLLIIPNVAIHMNRDMNKGVEYNPQTDMLPLYAGMDKKGSFQEIIAAAAGVNKEDILGSDLYLYVREKGSVFGAGGEFIGAPRLDDLECAFAASRAVIEAGIPEQYANMAVVFDNEEVGSGTKQGADSTFLEDILVRIKEAFGETESQFLCQLAKSFLISADNAHGVHPNHPEKADPTNRPFLNGGIVIKFHGGQKYTTDAFSASVMRDLCKKAKVPCQTYFNRSDIPGGSTLGNISTAHVSVNSVDIGLAQLAMHSAYETAGAKDVEYLLHALTVFYGEPSSALHL